MKLALGLVIAAATLAGGAVVGIHANQPQASFRSPDSITTGGYEGWWNATPLEGSAAGLPQETVSVNTNTGKIVDVFNRAMNDAQQVTQVSDVHFEVVPDPSWPKDSVVIIDTATGNVIESFPVDEKGAPLTPEVPGVQ